MATILVDLDGVLCTKGHKGHYVKARPIRKNIDIVNRLAEAGHKIIIHTARWAARDISIYLRLMNKVIAPKKVEEMDIAIDRYAWETMKRLTHLQLVSWGVAYDQVDFSKPESDFIVDDKAISLEKLEKALSPK